MKQNFVISAVLTFVFLTSFVLAGEPTINLESPDHLTQDWNNINLPFEFNVEDDVSSNVSCTLWIDDNPYGTNDTVFVATSTLILSNATLSNGDHTWYINCTDWDAETGQSSSRTIGVGAYFSRCAKLVTNGKTYYLNGSVDADVSICIEPYTDDIELDCQNNEVYGHGNWRPLAVYFQDNITFRNCIVSNGSYGNIYTRNSTNVLIDNCTSYDANEDGWGYSIWLSGKCDGSIVQNSYVYGTGYYGITIGTGYDGTEPIGATVQNNEVEEVDWGIYITGRNHTVTGNYLHDHEAVIGTASCLFISSHFYKAEGNLIYNNYFLRGSDTDLSVAFSLNVTGLNYFNVEPQTGSRIYTTGQLGGNYYGSVSDNDYSDTCEDKNYNRFCDNPLVYDENNTDYYPLTSIGLVGSQFPMIWILPIVLVLVTIFSMIGLAIRGKITLGNVLKIFFLVILTVAFTMAITGML